MCNLHTQGGGARLPFLHLICYREINMSICSLWWLFTPFCREAICAINLRCFVARPFLSEIYALLSVKFSGLKMCGCKKNDKFQVCIDYPGTSVIWIQWQAVISCAVNGNSGRSKIQTQAFREPVWSSVNSENLIAKKQQALERTPK